MTDFDTDTRPTGVKLHLLDTDKIVAQANGQTGEHFEVSFAPYAVAEHDGELYVICVEGVGWHVTDENPLSVDLFRKKPNTIAIMPSLQAKLDPAEVRELTTSTEIDLADLIRRFGSRLEANFWIWHRTLTAKVGA